MVTCVCVKFNYTDGCVLTKP